MFLNQRERELADGLCSSDIVVWAISEILGVEIEDDGELNDEIVHAWESPTHEQDKKICRLILDTAQEDDWWWDNDVPGICWGRETLTKTELENICA